MVMVFNVFGVTGMVFGLGESKATGCCNAVMAVQCWWAVVVAAVTAGAEVSGV